MSESKVLYFFGGIDGKSAGSFISTFMEADSVEGMITVFLSSGGGEVIPAIAMYDTIKCSRNQVLMVSVGEVASAAVLPYIGADARLMLPNSRLFLHETHACFPQDSSFKPDELLKASAKGSNTFTKYCEIVAENTKINLKAAMDLCRKETTLDPVMAVKFGFAEGQYKNNTDKVKDNSPIGKAVQKMAAKRLKK